MYRRTIFRGLVSIGLLGSLLPASSAAGQQEGSVWDLGRLDAGRTYNTTITATNESCRGRHDFEITVEGNASRYIRVTGPATLTGIGRGQSKQTDAVVDLRDAPPGSYEGMVRVRCTTCRASCRQDVRDLQVQFVVVGTANAPASPVATGTSGDATRVRGPCPESLAPCDELLRIAQDLDSEARAAEALADRLAESQEWNDSQAESIESFAESTNEFANERRRQAREWRQLADDAEADARVNTDRANRYPEGHPWRASWEAEAARDRARAAERRRRAGEIDAEANRLDGDIRRDTDRAEELRRRTEIARAQAAAKRQKAEDAWTAYEDCVAELRERCERQRRQAERRAAAQRAAETQARADAQARAQAARDAEIARAERAAAIATARLLTYQPLPARLAKVCRTISYNVPRNTIVESLRVNEVRGSDNAGAIEVRLQRTQSAVTGMGFTYHCIDIGTALITFNVADGATVTKYRLRIVCDEDN